MKSETSNNFDITFNYESGDFFAYASFYINDVDNYITLQDELDGHDDHDDETMEMSMEMMITMTIMEMSMGR